LQQIFLFNHLVGEREQRRRQVEAERFCGLSFITSSNLVGSITGRSDGFSAGTAKTYSRPASRKW
jgi:hypothetical protein